VIHNLWYYFLFIFIFGFFYGVINNLWF